MPGVARTNGGFIEISGRALTRVKRDLPMALYGVSRDRFGGMCVVCLRIGELCCKSPAGEAEFRLSGVCENCFDANKDAATFRHVEDGLAGEGDTRGLMQGRVELYLAIMHASISVCIPPQAYEWMRQRLQAQPPSPVLLRRSNAVDNWQQATAVNNEAFQIFMLEEGHAWDSESDAESALASALVTSTLGIVVFLTHDDSPGFFEELRAAGIAGSDGVAVAAWRAVASEAGSGSRRIGFLQKMGEWPVSLHKAWHEEPVAITKLLELACSPAQGRGSCVLAPGIDRCLGANHPSGLLYVWVPMTMKAQRA